MLNKNGFTYIILATLLAISFVACDKTDNSSKGLPAADGDISEGDADFLGEITEDGEQQESEEGEEATEEMLADGDEDAVEMDASENEEVQEASDDLEDSEQEEIEESEEQEETSETLENESVEVTEAESDCEPYEPFDYYCDPEVPETCPGGICLFSYCIGPHRDENRWADCGDGACGECETEETCPADCSRFTNFTYPKEHNNQTTLTVWVHGFHNKSADEMANEVYGTEDGCSGIIEDIRYYGGEHLPCGNTPETATAPNHVIKVEYYGGVAPDWMSEADVEEIEQFPYSGTTAIDRYALIVAKFIRHRLTISTATHVNLSCHSMGCFVIRHMIENNIENLAAEGRFVRWFTSAGVLGGAQLAHLYNNPQVQTIAELFGMELSDFVIMNPDNVMDETAAWDHKIHEGNCPYYRDMIIHHMGGTDPRIAEAMNFQLLELNNPDDKPNDGIMFLEDVYFHSMDDEAMYHARGGESLKSTMALVYKDHMNVPKAQGSGVLAAATMHGKRRIYVKVKNMECINDREGIFNGEYGESPGEFIFETEVRYNPFILDTYERDILVHDDKMAYRTPEVYLLGSGSQRELNKTLFEGPVFDEMQQLHLSFQILEVDWYPAKGIQELNFDAHEEALGFSGYVDIRDHELQLESEYARITLQVDVVEMY